MSGSVHPSPGYSLGNPSPVGSADVRMDTFAPVSHINLGMEDEDARRASDMPAPGQTAEATAERHRATHCRELREDLDRIRNEYQQMYAELQAYRRQPAPGLRPRLRRVVNRLRGRARMLLKRKKPAPPARPLDFAAQFAPYRVRQHQPTPPASRPRILHVIENFFTGGSAQLVVDIVERLGHLYEHDVLVRSLPQTPGYVGLRLHQVDEFHSPREVIELLERLRPDFLHVHYLADIHKAFEKAWSVHEWRWYHQIFLAAERTGSRIIQNVNIPTGPYISDRVEHYVYVSDYVKARHGRLDARNCTIYPGSDLDFFARGESSEVADDCIGMVYRLQADKLGLESIQVFIEVVRRRPQTRVVIVGGGDFLGRYQAQVEAAGFTDAFTFTRYVGYADLPKCLERMSVFVAPVHSESFGQVSPFAMGMGLPVAGYRVGALAEILGTDELLAPPGDVGALAGIIVGLLDDRERRLSVGAHNRERARRLFSVEAMVEGYHRLYEEVLRSRGGSVQAAG
jgi:glycosyltransferase involved in cell wall biosynthesis